jgi:hypothetical protein
MMNSLNVTTVPLPPAPRGEASAGFAPTRLSDFVPKDRTPRQNWGKFKAHKWGGFTGRFSLGEMEGGEDGPMDLLGGPTAHVRAAVQENLEQADHAHVMDFDSRISDRADGDGEGNAL